MPGLCVRLCGCYRLGHRHGPSRNGSTVPRNIYRIFLRRLTWQLALFFSLRVLSGVFDDERGVGNYPASCRPTSDTSHSLHHFVHDQVLSEVVPLGLDMLLVASCGDCRIEAQLLLAHQARHLTQERSFLRPND